MKKDTILIFLFDSVSQKVTITAINQGNEEESINLDIFKCKSNFRFAIFN